MPLQRANWEEFFNLSHDLLTIVSDDGFFKVLNPAWERVLGWSVEDLLAAPWLDFVHPEDRPSTIDHAAKVAKGHAAAFQNRYRTKDGRYRWILWSAVHDPDSQLRYGIGRDVTDEQEMRDALETSRAELAAQAEELRQREGMFRGLFEAAPDALFLVDSGGAILLANAQAEQMFGHEPGGLAGELIDALLPAEPRKTHARLRDGYLASPRPRRMGQGPKLKARRKDGTEFPVDVSLGAFSFQGRPTVLSVVRDVTVERKLEEQYRQAQKMEAIGSLAGGVAHDFNNLLSVILSYSSMLIHDLKPSDPMRADIEEIQSAGRRATDLTRQLLAFGRKQILRMTPLCLNDIVQGQEKLLRRLVGEDVELVFLPASPLGTVVVDASQIEQILMNLVVNARYAMPGGGRLTIETANAELDAEHTAEPSGGSPGPQVMLAVSDTGVGMDKATQSRIFEPFFTTKGVGEGTGLGLATVFGIVRQSGGLIWVDSEPGKGTTFKIYFPRSDRKVDPTLSTKPPPTPGRRGTETILLVEDEESVRTLASTILRRHGYHVLEAQNGGEALLICEQHGATISLLLTDMVMPRMSGRQLADRLKIVRPDLRVLFMSGYTDEGIVQHGVLHPGVAFLQKPITPDTLTQRVREVLDT